MKALYAFDNILFVITQIILRFMRVAPSTGANMLYAAMVIVAGVGLAANFGDMMPARLLAGVFWLIGGAVMVVMWRRRNNAAFIAYMNAYLYHASFAPWDSLAMRALRVATALITLAMYVFFSFNTYLLFIFLLNIFSAYASALASIAHEKTLTDGMNSNKTCN